MKLDSYIFTACGGRKVNEDSVCSRKLPDGELFVVADGLGGHQCGEIASACITEHFMNAPYEDTDPTDWLTEQLSQANDKILEIKQQQHISLKSTAAVLLIKDNTAVWAYVGDSRIYHIKGSSIADITADHSVAYKKYLAGDITREQIGSDEDQSSLLRALGNPERCAPDTNAPGAAVEQGDAFLLCSDGLWTYIRDQEIVIDRLKADTAKEWGELLLLRYMERADGGSDNISLITVMA